jgi:hypothetical protein
MPAQVKSAVSGGLSAIGVGSPPANPSPGSPARRSDSGGGGSSQTASAGPGDVPCATTSTHGTVTSRGSRASLSSDLSPSPDAAGSGRGPACANTSLTPGSNVAPAGSTESDVAPARGAPVGSPSGAVPPNGGRPAATPPGPRAGTTSIAVPGNVNGHGKSPHALQAPRASTSPQGTS